MQNRFVMSVLITALLGMEHGGPALVSPRCVYGQPVPAWLNPQLTDVMVENNPVGQYDAICPDLLDLGGGSLMIAYHRTTSVDWYGNYSVYTQVSHDGGLTWSNSQLAAASAQAPGLLRLPSGDILMSAAQLVTETSTTMRLLRSSDNGQSWVEQGPIWANSSGIQLQGGNGELVRLTVGPHAGRILLPTMFGEAGNYNSSFQSGMYYSDDNGVTWQTATGKVSLALRGAMEPSVAQLSDGAVVMAMRTELGGHYMARSTDGGMIWSEPWFSEVETGEECPVMTAFPDGSGLLMAYTGNKFDPNDPGGHFGPRSPLTVVVSKDGGHTWLKVGEYAGGNHEFGPTAITIADGGQGNVVLGYNWITVPWDRSHPGGGIRVTIGPTIVSTPLDQTRVWQGITNHNWAEANNWTWNWNGSVPVAVSPVQINSGEVQITADTDAVAQSLTTAFGAADMGTVNMSGGSLNVSSGLSIGRSGGSTFTQTGGQVHAASVLIGDLFGGNGVYDISGGMLIAGEIGHPSSAGSATINLSGTGVLRAGTIHGEGSQAITIHFTGGVLGVLSIKQSLTNAGGRLEAASSPNERIGTCVIEGDYNQTLGQLAVDLAGTDQGTAYDLFKISGTASLAGLIDVSLLLAFTPSHGDTFDVLTATSITDTSTLMGAAGFNKGIILGANGEILRLTYVPEPQALTQIGISAAILLLIITGPHRRAFLKNPWWKTVSK